MFLQKEFPWQITSILKDGGLTNIIELKPKFEGNYQFFPGQGAYFNFPRIRSLWVPRFFHFISAPSQENYLQIAVRLKNEWSHNIDLLNEGDIALTSKPVGKFSVSDFRAKDTLKRRIYIAGGIGITPFLAMLENSALTNCDRAITVLWGAENHDDLIQKDRIFYLTKNMPNLNVIPFLTHDPLWKGEKGRIDAEKLNHIIPKTFGFNEDSWLWNSPTTEYWLNGPKQFSKDIQKALKTLGVSGSAIHVEQNRQK